jgi:site-specific DNA-methyltransferase (adenine-specific)
MVGMEQYPDKYFDLAIVDPPYGIGEDGAKNHSRGSNAKPKMYTAKNWDRLISPKEYFIELIRVSKNQIIWGANHFIENIPNANSSGWVVWDKMDSENDFSSCELAYTSFEKGLRKFKFLWSGYWQGDMKNKEIRIHPTQKPVALYKWLLDKYAKPGDKILDTHLGSGSSRIAAYELGFYFTGYELDKEYFDLQEKRYKNHTAQLKIFTQ